MSFTALSPDWQMTVLFFLLLLPLCFLMKVTAFWGTPESKDWRLMLAPFPTPLSVKQALPLSAAPRLISRFLVALVPCGFSYWLCRKLWSDLRAPPILLCYAGAIILWLVTEALGSLAPLLALPAGKFLPLPHGASPPLARSLSDFWGRRWNVWMSGWFRQMIFRPLSHRPALALFAVFFASGVMHEGVINVPLYVVTGKNCFGTMMLYFLLQAVGILLERRTRRRGVRRLLVWLFVFGAAPLMVNEGLLRILHLWPE